MSKLKKIVRPDKFFQELINLARQANEKVAILSEEVETLKLENKEQAKEVNSILNQTNDLLLSQRFDVSSAKEKLEEIRKSPGYNKSFSTKTPLITVRIATYNRAKLLTERALPSILKQTYQNFEVVVIGDYCTDDTEERVKKLNDPRIKFHNLPQHSWYPEDKFKRWLVIGAAPANKAVELAKGDWIATLDDDDEFLPNHLEELIKLALKTKSELVYSALESTHELKGDKKIIWSDPPSAGSFSMMGALYLKDLSKIFKTDEQGWATRLPQDWYLCKRMLETGVRFVSTKTVTGKIHLLTYEEKDI